MDRPLPLPALLSCALVAFTIEFDNEAEHGMPHRTTDHGVTRHDSTAASSLHAPWLVSMVMWTNCMQFVGEKGITARELEDLARTKTNLNGMERWGYIVVGPDPGDRRPKPPRSAWVIRASSAGKMAQAIWRPLGGLIEKRWEERFGGDEVEWLREALSALAGKIDPELPDCLPILGYGLYCREPEQGKQKVRGSGPERPLHTPKGRGPALTLPALLSRVLLAFAVEFEPESEVSLAICANVLRLVGDEGVRVRDLPRLAGVSTEAIATAVSFLEKRGYAVVRPESLGSRAKVLMLTAKGRKAQLTYFQLVESIEERWNARFGKTTIRTLRKSLERLAGKADAESQLFRGLKPYPDGWRAAVPKPEVLPHFPMVLHRGGFPDGS
jgi:DNA-binding MarR family transcriptional regulator